jgi:hypothetical protein
MTQTLTIPPGERGTVRVFAIDLPAEEAQAFAADPTAVPRALGTSDLDPGHIDVFPVSSIAALGLPAFLAEGHGIPADALSADAAKLDALDGHIAVIGAGAFGPAGHNLTVRPPLRLVGTYRENIPPVSFSPLPAESATGVLGSPGPKPVPMPGGSNLTRILTILLLVLAVVGFIVLNGGQ